MRSQLAKQENPWPFGSSPWLDEKIGCLWYLSQLAADLGVIAARRTSRNWQNGTNWTGRNWSRTGQTWSETASSGTGDSP